MLGDARGREAACDAARGGGRAARGLAGAARARPGARRARRRAAPRAAARPRRASRCAARSSWPGRAAPTALAEHVRTELYADRRAAAHDRPRRRRRRSPRASGAWPTLAADGQTNRDIAQALYVTPKTVEVHLSNAYRKLEHPLPPRAARRHSRLRPPLGVGAGESFGCRVRGALDAACARHRPMLRCMLESRQDRTRCPSELQPTGFSASVLTAPATTAYDAARQDASTSSHRPAPGARSRFASRPTTWRTTIVALRRAHARPARRRPGHRPQRRPARTASRTRCSSSTDALRASRSTSAPRRARVGAGVALGGRRRRRASEHGLAALHGSSPDVGVAGYSLGGGMGWLARKHGLQTNASPRSSSSPPTASCAAIDADARARPVLGAARRRRQLRRRHRARVRAATRSPSSTPARCSSRSSGRPRCCTPGTSWLPAAARRDHDVGADHASSRRCRGPGAPARQVVRDRQGRVPRRRGRRRRADRARCAELGPDDGHVRAWSSRPRSATCAMDPEQPVPVASATRIVSGTSHAHDRRAARLRGPRLAVAARLGRAPFAGRRAGAAPRGRGRPGDAPGRLRDVRGRRRDEPGG